MYSCPNKGLDVSSISILYVDLLAKFSQIKTLVKVQSEIVTINLLCWILKFDFYRQWKLWNITLFCGLKAKRQKENRQNGFMFLFWEIRVCLFRRKKIWTFWLSNSLFFHLYIVVYEYKLPLLLCDTINLQKSRESIGSIPLCP